MSESQTTECGGWLIENGLTYFQISDGDDWTSDRSAALYFPRKEDAERMISFRGWKQVRVVPG